MYSPHPVVAYICLNLVKFEFGCTERVMVNKPGPLELDLPDGWPNAGAPRLPLAAQRPKQQRTRLDLPDGWPNAGAPRLPLAAQRSKLQRTSCPKEGHTDLYSGAQVLNVKELPTSEEFPFFCAQMNAVGLVEEMNQHGDALINYYGVQRGHKPDPRSTDILTWPGDVSKNHVWLHKEHFAKLVVINREFVVGQRVLARESVFYGRIPTGACEWKPGVITEWGNSPSLREVKTGDGQTITNPEIRALEAATEVERRMMKS